MRIYLETFGCQMNELDSDLVRGQLESQGYSFTRQDSDADIVLYNTCSVREHAEQKAYSRIGQVAQRKREGASIILGVLGCMAERDGVDMLRRHPQVDILCGPGELDKLPQLIDNVRRTQHIDDGAVRASRERRVALAGNSNRRSATLGAAQDTLEMLDLSRAFQPKDGEKKFSAYVRITRGCNKFCTYCVVPFTRGAEVHRPPDHIVEECKRLVDAGVLEITLLGQTVNHYRYVHGTALTVSGEEAPQVGPGLQAFRQAAPQGMRATTFAQLLRRIHDEVPELKRLRFVTSYPRDFGNDILQVMRECPRICRYLHAPAQSGSDAVLKRMNRGYSVAEYREFVARLFEHLPDATLAGDIIVGFPGETDREFEETCDLVRELPFKNNFIFKYSERPGTVAKERFSDDVPDSVKRWRNNTLLALQGETSARVHRSWEGKTVEVLFDQVRQRSSQVERNGHLNQSLSGGGVPMLVGGAPVTTRRLAEPAAACAREPERDLAVHQVTGRTPGDLIVAVDVQGHDSAQALVGRIAAVRITQSHPLLLQGILKMDFGP